MREAFAMGVKVCVVHKSAPAATLCFRCRKPICTACVVVMPYGQFCSMECSAMYREFMAGKPMGWGSRLRPVMTGTVLVLVMLLLLFGVIHYLAQTTDDPRRRDALQRIDLIGRFLRNPPRR